MLIPNLHSSVMGHCARAEWCSLEGSSSAVSGGQTTGMAFSRKGGLH
jgi:hypothetical protein